MPFDIGRLYMDSGMAGQRSRMVDFKGEGKEMPGRNTDPPPAATAPTAPPPTPVGSISLGSAGNMERMPRAVPTTPRKSRPTNSPSPSQPPPAVDTMPSPVSSPPVSVVPGNSGVTSLAGLPSSSPISLMNWQAGLSAGNTNAVNRSVGANELSATQLNNLLSSNSKYIQDARLRGREEAAGRGLSTSSYSAGASERAAIQSGLPIAQQDAATYGRTASENMAATNQDRLNDQSNAAALFGQSMGIQANLDESERNRGFASAERVGSQNFTSGENALNRAFTTGERLGTQAFQTGERLGGQRFTAGENALNRTFTTGEREANQLFAAGQNQLQRNFNGDQNALQRENDRIGAYYNATFGREGTLAATLNSIYSNPNLKASEQAAAARNAEAVIRSTFEATNRALSAGIPQIFTSPYQIPNPPPTQPPPAAAPPPPPPPPTPPPLRGRKP